MNRGYVRLWRKSLDAGWIRNHKLWAFWTYCLSLHIECGVMRSLIERFPGDNTRQWAEYFIRLNGAEIEKLMEEVEYDRRTARELEGL